MLHRIVSSILVAVIASFISAFGEMTAREAFASAPSNVFPLLDGNTRLDMIDYYKSGMTTPSANSLKGTSTITSLDDRQLTVKMTDSSTAQVIVLPAGNSQVIAVISTVATPGLDSKISFYDTSWNPLPADRYFAKPGMTDWLTDEGKANKEEVTMQVPFILSSYAYDPATGTLTVTNNLNRFLDADIYSIVEPYLRPSLTYTWNGKKFTPVR